MKTVMIQSAGVEYRLSERSPESVTVEKRADEAHDDGEVATLRKVWKGIGNFDSTQAAWDFVGKELGLR